MKDYILNLIANALEDNKVKGNPETYDIAFLKEVVQRVSSDKEYFYSFILDLNSDLVKNITMLVEPADARDSFLASLIYLKKLIEVNAEEDVKIPLSLNQEELLYQLLELIKKIIAKDDEISDAKTKYLRKNAKRLESLNSRLKKKKQLEIEDYDLIENLIKNNETGNVNKKLNEVVDFLNEYNYDLLPEFVERPAMTEEETHEENISQQIETTGAIEESPEEEAEVINVKKSIDFDIFNPQSFVYDANNEPPKKRGRKKKNEVVEELSISDEEVEQAITYNKEKLYKYQEELMDEESINDLINFFKINNLSDDVINDLINRCTPIFFEKNRDGFKDNVRIALTYGANIEKLIKRNITFFYNTPKYNKNKIELLEKKGLNVSLIFEHQPQILAVGLETLLKNLDILKSYNLDILDDDYDSLSIITSSNLSSMLDTFIEAGFSTYLATDGLKNIRSLIIKRIFYAYKNDLDVWKENISEDRINEEYESWIKKELVILNEEEISYLINDYPELESLDLTKRPAFFTDPEGAQIRRKYEFKFDNIIISRIKTYSVFKVLVNHAVDVNEAIFYALTYNLNVDVSDYMLIKEEILRK